MTRFGKTTAPGAATTADDAGERPSLALVIAWSVSQPHRAGEVAFFPAGERLVVGRGEGNAEGFAHFVRQRPGEVPAVDPREALLDGASLSRRQLVVRSTGEALEVERTGGCRTYFNGNEATCGVLHPGDTVMLRNEVVLLCVSRPRELPALPLLRELHAFGGPDRDGIVGESPAAWRLRDELARAARGRSHVLLLGDSGTGKEMAAKVVHERSSRAGRPWISRNAPTLSPALIASELFGNPAHYPNHGAPARRGLVGTADGGTLFLDEIGDLSLDAQAQLLRVMDAGEYQAVGEAAVRRTDVRFVGATNKDESHFRADFLARFLVRVRLPPLRERREDIALLARDYLLRHARVSADSELRERLLRPGTGGRLEPKLGVRLVDELVRLPLPLNARELQGLLLQAVSALQAAGASEGEELRMPATTTTAIASAAQAGRMPRAPSGDAGPSGVPSKEDVLACLEREEWNVARAARRLGMERTALYRLMKSYGIDREPREAAPGDPVTPKSRRTF
jgi:DNA-binding NtrC family response regulator